jgi:hypothetical protein
MAISSLRLRFQAVTKNNLQKSIDLLPCIALHCNTQDMEILLNKSVRLSQDQIASVEKLALQQNRKFGQIIRIAIDRFLQNRQSKNGK